jgi:hypothetical protein
LFKIWIFLAGDLLVLRMRFFGGRFTGFSTTMKSVAKTSRMGEKRRRRY